MRNTRLFGTFLLAFSLVVFLAGHSYAQGHGPVNLTLTITHVRFSPNPDSDNVPLVKFKEDPELYVKVWIDGKQLSNRSHAECPGGQERCFEHDLLVTDANWVSTHQVAPSHNVPIRIQLWDRDDYFDDQLDINPRSRSKDLNLTYDTVTGQWSGDVSWPARCASNKRSLSPANELCFSFGQDIGDTRRPLIFIPGMAGSALTEVGGRRPHDIWPKHMLRDEIRKLTLDPREPQFKQHLQSTRRNTLPVKLVDGSFLMCHKHLACALV